MQTQRPYVISIGGLDPSAGAGVLSDVKTFEAHGTLGFGVTTAITAQTGQAFHHISWLDDKEIIYQLKPLMDEYPVDYAKIGLIRDMKTLQYVIARLKEMNPIIKIIWDPIIKASAGYVFHKSSFRFLWTDILPELYLVTPNFNEAAEMTGLAAVEGCEKMAQLTNIFLKGGHNEQKKAYDILYQTHNKRVVLPPATVSDYQKHGSGCVISSSITSFLALGFSLKQACQKAKNYVSLFMNSNPSLLGFHNTIANEN